MGNLAHVCTSMYIWKLPATRGTGRVKETLFLKVYLVVDCNWNAPDWRFG
jgi:hypothetical protein